LTLSNPRNFYVILQRTKPVIKSTQIIQQHITGLTTYDLKLGKLNHRDIGQMDLYVRWFEENLRTQTDNPTIGIILCSEKNETIVKYFYIERKQTIVYIKI